MIRRVLLALATAIALFALIPAPPAQAAEACGVTLSCVTTYYNNSQHSVVVGHRYVTCEGFYWYDGTVTVYKTVVSEPCA